MLALQCSTVPFLWGKGKSDEAAAFHHLLHQLISGRAIFYILLMYMGIFTELFCKMWESCTVGGPDLIHTTLIIFKSEELARLFFIQPVAIFFSFFIKPLLFKLINSLIKMGRDP